MNRAEVVRILQAMQAELESGGETPGEVKPAIVKAKRIIALDGALEALARLTDLES